MPRSSYVAALDVGTAKVAAAVAEVRASGEFAVIGLGRADTNGIRRGTVVDLQAATGSIIRAVMQAELMAGVRMPGAFVGLSGSHVTGFNSRGVVSVAGDDRVITEADVTRAVDAATGMGLPDGREIVHVLPQDFSVDDQSGIAAPIGLTGLRLEANVHVSTVQAARAHPVIDAVNNAGLLVQDLVLDSLAASEAVLSDDEKRAGVTLIDVGAGASRYAIFEHGSLSRTGSIAIGGDHLTTAIAVSLRTPPPEAERLKRRWAYAGAAAADDCAPIEIPSLGRGRARQMPRRVLLEIIEQQAGQLFAALRDEIFDQGFAHALPAGVVLTGGGSIPAGMTGVAEALFQLPVRRGSPVGLGGLAADTTAPALATAVGLLLHGHRHAMPAPLGSRAAGADRRRRGWFGGGRMAMRAS